MCVAENDDQLQECFDGAKQYREVKVRGKLFVTHSNFNINHSINIVGQQDAMIKGVGGSHFLLNVKGENVSIYLSNVYFQGIQIVKAEHIKVGLISVNNCTSQATTDSSVLLKSNVSEVAVSLKGSNFIDSTNYVLSNEVEDIRSKD